MSPSAHRRFGHIIKPHGLKGLMKIRLQADAPRDCWQAICLYLSATTSSSTAPQSYAVTRFSETTPGFGLLGLKEVTSLETADSLRNHAIHLLDKEGASLNTQEGLAYLIDYDLEVEGKVYGQITDWLAYAANPLLVLTDKKQQTHLIPAQKDWIEQIDKKKRRLVMRLPDGLLDLSPDTP